MIFEITLILEIMRNILNRQAPFFAKIYIKRKGTLEVKLAQLVLQGKAIAYKAISYNNYQDSHRLELKKSPQT